MTVFRNKEPMKDFIAKTAIQIINHDRNFNLLDLFETVITLDRVMETIFHILFVGD